MMEAGHLTEAQAATTMQQMGRAMARAFGGGVCRRDLKIEEFLVLIKKTGGKRMR